MLLPRCPAAGYWASHIQGLSAAARVSEELWVGHYCEVSQSSFNRYTCMISTYLYYFVVVSSSLVLAAQIYLWFRLGFSKHNVCIPVLHGL